MRNTTTKRMKRHFFRGRVWAACAAEEIQQSQAVPGRTPARTRRMLSLLSAWHRDGQRDGKEEHPFLEIASEYEVQNPFDKQSGLVSNAS